MTEYIETRWSAEGSDFADLLVGRRIVELAEDKVVLDDGTELVLEPGGDCCAYFEGVFRAIDLDDNVITRVEQVPHADMDEAGRYTDDLFSIFIYTAHKQIAAADVKGSEGSGYYGSSINIEVRR